MSTSTRSDHAQRAAMAAARHITKYVWAIREVNGNRWLWRSGRRFCGMTLSPRHARLLGKTLIRWADELEDKR
jgi:hypothetical protein